MEEPAHHPARCARTPRRPTWRCTCPSQTAVLFQDGKPRLITHISTGTRQGVVRRRATAAWPITPGGVVPVRPAGRRLGRQRPRPAVQPGVLQLRRGHPRRLQRAALPGLALVRAHPDAHRQVLPVAGEARRPGVRVRRREGARRRTAPSRRRSTRKDPNATTTTVPPTTAPPATPPPTAAPATPAPTPPPTAPATTPPPATAPPDTTAPRPRRPADACTGGAQCAAGLVGQADACKGGAVRRRQAAARLSSGASRSKRASASVATKTRLAVEERVRAAGGALLGVAVDELGAWPRRPCRRPAGGCRP